MLGIIGTILKLGGAVFGLRGALAKARSDRKDKVADFLGNLAQTIEDVSAQLRQGTYPSGKCQQVLMHAEHMEAAIGDLIGDREAAALGKTLKGVHEVEGLGDQMLSLPPDERERELRKLDEAAGLFRATAAFVRVSP